MNKNSIRYDLSDWLIHFFRDIDFEGNNSIIYPEHMGFGNVVEDFKWSALFMLRCAIKHGRLWATWSYRNNVRTIYGPNPAVCFTEMPIAAFLEAGEARSRRGEAMSQFALVFPKKELFKVGANPVIYGLDDRNYWPPSGKGGGSRIIDPERLPEREQYRYVTYNPASSSPIDWTHEREWRWPYRGDISAVEKAVEEYGMVGDALDIPGLDFYEYLINEMGVVVRDKKQATWIAHDILSLIDREVIRKDQYKFILAADELPPTHELISPSEVSRAISDSLIDLEPIFSYDDDELTAIASKFHRLASAVESSAPQPEAGEFGGCWLWMLDNTSKLVRALIADERLTVTESGKYLASLFEFSDSRSLRQRETMAVELARLVESEFGVECGYSSVLNSDDPNGIPFYNDDHLDNHMHYNVSWEY
ncbi:hypothetical protein DO97_21640 [Neosynechococcus sphagnicola sy1]|uniref:DUF4427 domain-containing protein n=1 Tax=Neosynechococcus sphagnicola sy1 TaxID=1497020 RepID=A0A098TFM9_9CYAN|nr:DUF4427 domain-containing protein [Neosynechococcus sphagnicola]KGF71365.1 hypothetical protein DO97_21640 [Neosynechococcus sphagnicola sy1]